MRWLIDGYNVIRLDAELRAAEAGGLEAGRAALLRRLAGRAKDLDDVFTVVFDGARLRASEPPPSAPGGRIEVTFSRAPDTADEVLRRLAERWRDAAIVVSSDRAVQTSARRSGAVAVSAGDFLDALAGGTAEATDDENEDEDQASGRGRKQGNPRRASRDERAARRALRRLRG